jgi:hypothetical protein
MQVLCQSRLCKADHAYIKYLMLQRQLSQLNGRKLDHRRCYVTPEKIEVGFLWSAPRPFLGNGSVNRFRGNAQERNNR